MEKISISEAARRLSVNRTTLHRWIEQGVIPQPIAENVAGTRLRYWTSADFAKVEDYKRTKYWGRGKKRIRRKKTNRRKL
jgi:excisionase family DNA binding protein